MPTHYPKQRKGKGGKGSLSYSIAIAKAIEKAIALYNIRYTMLFD
jgi:hypothetical protein